MLVRSGLLGHVLVSPSRGSNLTCKSLSQGSAFIHLVFFPSSISSPSSCTAALPRLLIPLILNIVCTKQQCLRNESKRRCRHSDGIRVLLGCQLFYFPHGTWCLQDSGLDENFDGQMFLLQYKASPFFFPLCGNIFLSLVSCLLSSTCLRTRHYFAPLHAPCISQCLQRGRCV